MHNSPTGSILFDDCVIPADCLIGPENDAYPLIKTLLNVGRLNMLMSVSACLNAMLLQPHYITRT